MPERKDRSHYVVRVLTAEEHRRGDAAPPAGEDCIAMIWELTKNAYAFAGCSDADLKLRRDIVHVSFNGHP